MSNIRASSFDTPFRNPNYAAPPDGDVLGGGPLAPWNGEVGGAEPPHESHVFAASRTSVTGQEQALPTQELLSQLLHWEGDLGHMYLDTKGLVTVGIGNLVGSATAAQRLPFVDAATGRPATPEHIADAFATVGHLETGKRASFYADATTIRLPEDTIRTLAASRLENEFLPGLRRQFPGFAGYPAPAQRALVDMAYNMGVAGVGRFHNLREACETGDWQTAATECHRRSCRAERNEWTRDLFVDAAGAAPENS